VTGDTGPLDLRKLILKEDSGTTLKTDPSSIGAFELGKKSSLFENPYWKDYPLNPGSHEADLGRWFVEGWCQR